MSESECEFFQLIRHKYTVEVCFTYLQSVFRNVGLFMVGLMRYHCTFFLTVQPDLKPKGKVVSTAG